MTVVAATELAQETRASRVRRTATPRCRGHRGPIQTGSVGPNTLTTGRSSATARCIGPESLVTLMAERRINAASSVSVVSPATLTAPGASRATSSQTGALAARSHQRHGKAFAQECRATSANLSLPQCLVSQIVPGAMVTRPLPADAMAPQQGVDLGIRRRRNGKGKIRRPLRQAEKRPDAEITVDRMHVEAGHRMWWV